MPLLNNNETNLPTTSYVENSSCNLESLYCSHLWSNSSLRRTIINAPITDNKITKYCTSCRGKIRNYKLKSANENFTPKSYSTPREKFSVSRTESKFDDLEKITRCDDGSLARNLNENEIVNLNKTIPTISEDIDPGIQHKFRCISYDTSTTNTRQERFRKSLKGIGCFVDLTQSSIKKRTQLQVCSISIMILAIVIISLILVNFTSNHETQATNIISTNAVPTKNIDLNKVTSATASIYSELPLTATVGITEIDTTIAPFTTTEKNVFHLSNILTKIRKNIKTYPKQGNKTQPSFNISKDSTTGVNITQKFCGCQKTEVCMLEETTGTSICLYALDPDDPTGCGGLCALETEACHLVDKARGVRVCRPLGAVLCAAHEWRCRNGFCVSKHARCNGSIECYDRSDEMYCDCDLTKEFRCGQSISCFPKAKLCDGAIDCWDGLDEINCTPECPDYQFTCTNGDCIASSRFCDGLADCSDHSDEPTGCDGGCNAHEMRCSNKRCVPRLLRCDGRDDCGDNSDELHCP